MSFQPLSPQEKQFVVFPKGATFNGTIVKDIGDNFFQVGIDFNKPEIVTGFIEYNFYQFWNRVDNLNFLGSVSVYGVNLYIYHDNGEELDL